MNMHTKWYDDNFSKTDFPDKDTLDQLYKWFPLTLLPKITRKKFRILFDIALTRYRERKENG